MIFLLVFQPMKVLFFRNPQPVLLSCYQSLIQLISGKKNPSISKWLGDTTSGIGGPQAVGNDQAEGASAGF
jgi:hypothetical protein